MAGWGVTSDVIEGMQEHARQEYPLECCGLLTGHGKVIDGIQRATNERRSSRSFFVPPVELLAFMKATRRENREFLGIYHSHPDGNPRPSRRDANEFHYPGVGYWIVAVEPSRTLVRCYRWSVGEFRADSFEVLPARRRASECDLKLA